VGNVSAGIVLGEGLFIGRLKNPHTLPASIGEEI
jgi:hypothetical protein